MAIVDEDDVMIVITQTFGGTSNTNSNTNSSSTYSTSDNHTVSVNKSRTESTVSETETFENHTTSSNHTTTSNESRENRQASNLSNTSARSKSESTNVVSSNASSFSQTDIDVSVIRVGAAKHESDQHLLGVIARANGHLGRQRLALAFADGVFNSILPLIQSAT